LKIIGEIITWFFVSLFLLWLIALAVAPSPCARVYRAAWPVTGLFSVAEFVSQNWTSPGTKLTMLHWKARSAVFASTMFETTVYGDTLSCPK